MRPQLELQQYLELKTSGFKIMVHLVQFGSVETVHVLWFLAFVCHDEQKDLKKDYEFHN